MRGLVTALLAGLLVLALLGPDLYRQHRAEAAMREFMAQLDEDIARSLADIDDEQVQRKLQAGSVVVLENGTALHTDEVQRLLHDVADRDLPRRWRSRAVDFAALTAPGVDRQHYFVNSYLLGFRPFETDRVWVPLYTLALRKHYEYDHVQYSGLRDVWQNSIQSYLFTRGDCEDHAILLADWLVGLGYEARVVLGTYDREGHAWVVLRHDGSEYVLEATSKRRALGTELFLPAQRALSYAPEFQFDREYFWVNTGSRLTTSYFDPKWVPLSRYRLPE